MKPTRAVGIIITDNKVLLMHRIKKGEEYYTFPGGSVEKNETVSEAVIREIMEETTIDTQVERELYYHDYNTSEGHYFLCNYLKGTPKLGNSIEKKRMEKGKGDYYNPEWIEIDKLGEMLIYPLEIRDWLIVDLKKGFSDKVHVAKLKSTELRQSL